MAKSFFTPDQQEFLLTWIKGRDRPWRENQGRYGLHEGDGDRVDDRCAGADVLRCSARRAGARDVQVHGDT